MQRYQDEPIEIGFRVAPRTREYRRVEADRDYNEKQRVMQRHENFERHEEAQFTDGSYTEHHRFGDDFMQMQKQEMQQKAQQKQEYYQMLRDQQRERDQMYIDRDIQLEQRRQEQIQQRCPRKNQSGEKFNIVTREYFDPAEQERVEQQHQADLDAASARRKVLAQKQGLGVNLLTGEKFDWNK